VVGISEGGKPCLVQLGRCYATEARNSNIVIRKNEW